VFRSINFDIVGGCNAKCPFCVTARTSFGRRIQSISVKDFSRTLDRLLELDLLAPKKSVVMLYNWGEPMLHPKINDIVQELYDRRLSVGISTNASKKTTFVGPTGHFDHFTFSVPGWSQSSYDKIHDLKFGRVVANMEASVKNLRDNGYYGPIRLSFHVYRFNVDEELPRAREWCLKHGVDLEAYAAYLNDYEPMIQFRRGALPPDKLAYASENLFLDHVDDMIKAQPKEWRCPQWSKILTLNHRSEVLLCCVVPEGHEAYAIGSIFDLTREQIVAGKTTNKECAVCMEAGAAYWAHNPKRIELMKRPRSIRHRIGRLVRPWLPERRGALG
jgi:MoaA/NifB/PqqE/SkfB family radical SAM enzyme